MGLDYVPSAQGLRPSSAYSAFVERHDMHIWLTVPLASLKIQGDDAMPSQSGYRYDCFNARHGAWKSIHWDFRFENGMDLGCLATHQDPNGWPSQWRRPVDSEGCVNVCDLQPTGGFVA